MVKFVHDIGVALLSENLLQGRKSMKMAKTFWKQRGERRWKRVRADVKTDKFGNC